MSILFLWFTLWLYVYKSSLATNRPIIGILTKDISDFNQHNFPNKSQTIAASYVKYLESGGARIVPLLINKDDAYYDLLFSSLNGLLIPGGGVSLTNSGYARAGKAMFSRALRAAKEKGDYFPIWGTCLGFELLAQLSNDNIPVLTSCNAQNVSLPLILTDSYSSSSLGSSAPPMITNTLSTQNVTINFHEWCLTSQNVSYFAMDKFWNVLAKNYDKNNIEFISLIEAKNYPFWGSQFHPEKSAFEWKLSYPKGFHTTHGIFANNWFANFFVNEARKNNHSFSSESLEDEYLIYNTKPEFTENSHIHSDYLQTYFFD